MWIQLGREGNGEERGLAGRCVREGDGFQNGVRSKRDEDDAVEG